MTVWIVSKGYPNLDLVDDDLNVRYADVCEIVGVFAEERDARHLQEKLVAQSALDVLYCECDPFEVYVAEYEVW